MYNRILKSLEYIEENICSITSFKDAANSSNYSPFHFHKIFSQTIGESPSKFITRLRLEKIAWAIKNCSHLSITEIIFHFGFTSSQTFSRLFKQHFGITPSGFRKAHTHTNSFEHANFEDVHIIKQPSITAASICSMEGYKEEIINYNWQILLQWAKLNNIPPHSMRFGISYDDPQLSPPNKQRYKVCIQIPKVISTPPEIDIITLPEIYFAELKLNCKPRELVHGYQYLYQYWLPENGYYPAMHVPIEKYSSINMYEQQDIRLCIPIKQHSKIC